jgi:hypothetical protein
VNGSVEHADKTLKYDFRSLSMSSVSAISGLAGGQAALWPASLADQVAQDLQILLAALQSGDTVGANQALTALQTLVKTSGPLYALISRNLQVPGDFTLISQALDSGESTMISSAFSALQRDLTAAVTSVFSRGPQLQCTPASRNQELGSGDSITLNSASSAFPKSAAVQAAIPPPTSSVASLAYASTYLSAAFPEGHSSANSMALQAEANLLSAQGAQEAAKLTTPVNPNLFLDLGAHGTTYLTGLLLISIIVLLLFCLF